MRFQQLQLCGYHPKSGRLAWNSFFVFPPPVNPHGAGFRPFLDFSSKCNTIDDYEEWCEEETVALTETSRRQKKQCP